MVENRMLLVYNDAIIWVNGILLGRRASVVTLKDIARIAQVSPMTVSRVVNKQYAKVSPQTKERVLKIIKEQGYVPNSSARSLSSKATRLIAIIVQGTDNALEYPYNAAMAGHVCRFIQDKGYSPLLYFVNDYGEVTQRLRAWHVDGAIFMGMFDDDMRNIQEDHTIPLIFTDSYSQLRQVTNIGLNDYRGGELAGHYLLKMGHRNIGFLGASTDLSTIVRQRYIGLRDSLKKESITLNDRCVIFDSLFESPARALMQSAQRPTAIFAASDIEAIRLMDLVRNMGLSVPDDLSVIGFDNLPLSAFTSPRLTTIAQDIRQKALLATEVLFRHILDKSAPAENIILNVKLVERESVIKIL